MSEIEKTFVIPIFGTTVSKDLTTLMNPISLAVARETGQFESVSHERRSAFVEMLGHLPESEPSSEEVLQSKHYDLSEPRSIKEVLADENAPQDLKDSIEKMLEGLRNGTLSLS